MLRPLVLMFCALLTLGAVANPPSDSEAKPLLSLSYGFYLGGLENGTVQRQLYQTGEHEYEFRTHVIPSGIAAWYLKKTMYQITRFRVTARGIEPLHYEYYERGKKQSAPITIDFDWLKGIARQSQPTQRQWPLDKLYADTDSSLFSIIFNAIHQRPEFTIAVLSGKKQSPESYRYRIMPGQHRLDTEFGDLDVIYIREVKPDSARLVNVTWLAPSMGYIPVRIDQEVRGEPDLSMRLQRFQADDPQILARILAR